jgi:hypothetical protein
LIAQTLRLLRLLAGLIAQTLRMRLLRLLAILVALLVALLVARPQTRAIFSLVAFRHTDAGAEVFLVARPQTMAIRWPGATVQPPSTKRRASQGQTAAAKKKVRHASSDVFPSGVNVISDMCPSDLQMQLEGLAPTQWNRARTYGMSKDQLLCLYLKATHLRPEANLAAICEKQKTVMMQLAIMEHARHGSELLVPGLDVDAVCAEFMNLFGKDQVVKWAVHPGATPGSQFIQG